MFQFSPFNDFQGLTGCLKNGVHSNYPVTGDAFQQANVATVQPPPPDMGPLALLPSPAYNGFVSGLNSTGSALTFSTFLGGSATDLITAMVRDAAGNFYLAGQANSADFPGVEQVPAECHPDLEQGLPFVTRLSADGTSLSPTQLLAPWNSPTNPQGPVLALGPANLAYVALENRIQVVDLYAPPPAIACVTDSAQYNRISAVAPGELISIYGHLGEEMVPAASLPQNGQIPTSIAGIGVRFNGVPAPVLYISPTQYNVQVPYEVTGSETVHLEVDTQPFPGAPVPVGLDMNAVDAAPAIFAHREFWVCQNAQVPALPALALNPDGSTNSCDNPAPPDSAVTLYVTGLGNIVPGLVTGAVHAGPAQTVSVQVAFQSGSDAPTETGELKAFPGVINGVWLLQMKLPNPVPLFTTPIVPYSINGVALPSPGIAIFSR